MANVATWRLSTGSEPGRPRHTGQTLVLGSSPNWLGHEQKIFVAVASSQCTSRPTTSSHSAPVVGLVIVIFSAVTGALVSVAVIGSLLLRLRRWWAPPLRALRPPG